MKEPKRSLKGFGRFLLFYFSLLFFLAALQVRHAMVIKEILDTSIVWNAFIVILVSFGFICAIFGLVSPLRSIGMKFSLWMKQLVRLWGKGITLFFITLISFFYILFFLLKPSFIDLFGNFFPRFLLLSLCSYAIYFLIQVINIEGGRSAFRLTQFLLIPLLLVIGERTAMSISFINNIPFSLDWAESSHLYFASVVFAKKIYGESLPMYPYNQTRYIMQSLPFLLNSLPIWVHRAWQFFLDNFLIFIFSFFLVRRFIPRAKIVFWMAVSFCFLWLSLIYIYYHLVVIALLIVVFYTQYKWKRNLFVIVITSFWAGFSRINWIPVPGLLASFIYFLETPYKDKGIQIKYLQKPFWYSLLGIFTGLIAQFLYISVSGNENSGVHTAFLRSLLLWYRLLPNPTFSLGILFGILLISGFLIVFVVKYFFFDQRISLFRKMLIAIILIAFFIGGLTVSVKVGGGNNLHNMDAFSVFLITMAGFLFFHCHKLDQKFSALNAKGIFSIVLMGILVTPIVWSLFFPVSPNQSQMNATGAKEVIEQMNDIIDVYAPNREVLLISQRHLVPFGYLKNVGMIPEYEQELLMETVMSQDSQRLKPFIDALTNHNYEVIISYPLNTIVHGNELPYAVENNLWVSWVSSHIYLHYKTIAIFRDYNIEMLIPK